MEPSEIVVGGFYLSNHMNVFERLVFLVIAIEESGYVRYKCLTMEGRMWSWPIVRKPLNVFCEGIKGRVQPRRSCK